MREQRTAEKRTYQLSRATRTKVRQLSKDRAIDEESVVRVFILDLVTRNDAAKQVRKWSVRAARSRDGREPRTIRLTTRTIDDVRDLAVRLDCSKTDVVEAAVWRAHAPMAYAKSVRRRRVERQRG